MQRLLKIMILNFSLQLSQDTESIITNHMERKIYTPNILISKGQNANRRSIFNLY